MSDFCSGFEFDFESESYLQIDRDIFHFNLYVQSLKVVVVYFRLYFIVIVTTLSPKMDLPLFEFAFCLFLFVVWSSGGWRRCSEGER